MKITLGEETYPARYIVCPSCKGQGTSSRYLGAFTSEDMQELGNEFQDSYMKGDYDRECDECQGRTTILIPDENMLTEAQQQEIDNYYQEIANLRAMEAAERRMGA